VLRPNGDTVSDSVRRPVGAAMHGLCQCARRLRWPGFRPGRVSLAGQAQQYSNSSSSTQVIVTWNRHWQSGTGMTVTRTTTVTRRRARPARDRAVTSTQTGLGDCSGLCPGADQLLEVRATVTVVTGNLMMVGLPGPRPAGPGPGGPSEARPCGPGPARRGARVARDRSLMVPT
jgi:hypothetical protein